MNSNATWAAFVGALEEPPRGQAESLSCSTHMELCVYHPPSWQVAPHPHTSVSSSTARPLPPPAAVKGEERRLHGQGYFSSPPIAVW